MMDKMHKFWAGGFLYNPSTNSVFLHKRDSNTKFNPNSWAFFGGLSENNETPVECFIRELHEEIGLSPKTEEVLKLCDYFNEEFETHRYVFYVLSHKHRHEFILGEGADFDWVKLDDMNKLPLTEKTAKDLILFRERV